MNDEAVPAPDPQGPSRKPPDEAIAEARVRAPTRGNRKLEQFLDAVNGDEQVRAWWYMAQVHAERLGMSDHSWVHTQIVLNIGPLAANRLKIGNDIIECSVRFSGAARELVIPVAAVTAIYARETGQGMSFEREKKAAEGEVAREEPVAPDPNDPPKTGNKPALRRIK